MGAITVNARRIPALLAGLALIGALVLSSAMAASRPGKTELISRQSAGAGGAGGDGESFNPAVSANGRFVAFETLADNLGGPREDDVSNIYVYDRKRNKVELVSRRSRSAGGLGGNGDSFLPSITADGRYVAFETLSTNLGGSVSSDSQIYVYDRKRDAIRLISRRSKSAGGDAGDDESFNGVISGNGRYVGFETLADNLGGPAADVYNVYVYDRKRKTVRLVSRRSKPAGGQGGDANSFNPDLSRSGRNIAFFTEAQNLGGPIATPLPEQSNVYVYDLKRKKMQLVSRRSKGAGGGGGTEDSEGASISANGRYVAFETDAVNLGGPLNTGPDDDNVYVYDRERRKVQLISRRSKGAGGEGGDDLSEDPAISSSGRLVTFESEAQNLGGPIATLAGDTNVYVYNRALKRVALISRRSKGAGGAGGDDESEDAAISANGLYVAFETEAQNLGGPIELVADEENVYLRTLDSIR